MKISISRNKREGRHWIKFSSGRYLRMSEHDWKITQLTGCLCMRSRATVKFVSIDGEIG